MSNVSSWDHDQDPIPLEHSLKTMRLNHRYLDTKFWRLKPWNHNRQRWDRGSAYFPVSATITTTKDHQKTTPPSSLSQPQDAQKMGKICVQVGEMRDPAVLQGTNQASFQGVDIPTNLYCILHTFQTLGLLSPKYLLQNCWWNDCTRKCFSEVNSIKGKWSIGIFFWQFRGLCILKRIFWRQHGENRSNESSFCIQFPPFFCRGIRRYLCLGVLPGVAAAMNGKVAVELGMIAIVLVQLPGTPKNQLKMDGNGCWLNNHFLCKDLESSNWNNHL